ncbi:hypothetical protein HYPSUDRAFT_64231 [Hypholoma sublateritium FD-334 SS-4]|uniref:Uncharacterized protein n=1 Tax=Hypholoma sublateritium (strain FD-334 SS-4) TaxID=945553 RepID=A0A0D2MPV1_HYPSF|nr:hypothetical protein HYPSUDRAFT_64231 [Hypholoma sublateritium FD-334 SS-4]
MAVSSLLLRVVGPFAGREKGLVLIPSASGANRGGRCSAPWSAERAEPGNVHTPSMSPTQPAAHSTHSPATRGRSLRCGCGWRSPDPPRRTVDVVSTRPRRSSACGATARGAGVASHGRRYARVAGSRLIGGTNPVHTYIFGTYFQKRPAFTGCVRASFCVRPNG